MTEPTTDKIELLKMALLEAGQPPNLVAQVHARRRSDTPEPVLAHPAWMNRDVLRKAILLVRLRVSGPQHPVTCAVHWTPNRPDVWATCGRVPVADALLGRTCGAP